MTGIGAIAGCLEAQGLVRKKLLQISLTSSYSYSYIYSYSCMTWYSGKILEPEKVWLLSSTQRPFFNWNPAKQVHLLSVHVEKAVLIQSRFVMQWSWDWKSLPKAAEANAERTNMMNVGNILLLLYIEVKTQCKAVSVTQAKTKYVGDVCCGR